MSAPDSSAPSPRLAIVIPAYKCRHLRRTLDSIAAQTHRGFHVYVGDDASPEDIAGVVNDYRGRFALTYHRFAANLGHTSLARHWERVIALGDEPWIWVFSDDDLMAPDCVEGFYAEVEKHDPRTLFCFDLACIDDEDRLNGVTAHYPAHQSWEDHVRAMLGRMDFFWTIQNMVFPREVFVREGGFYDFPLGHHVDYLTWAKFARPAGIRVLPQGRIFYRQHLGSIGGETFQAGRLAPLIAAQRRSIEELRRLFAARGAVAGASSLVQLRWFCRFFRYRLISASERQLAVAALAALWPDRPWLRRVLFAANCRVATWRARGWVSAVNAWRARWHRRRPAPAGGHPGQV